MFENFNVRKNKEQYSKLGEITTIASNQKINYFEAIVKLLRKAWTTEYGHTKPQSLILCGPNSNPNPKY